MDYKEFLTKLGNTALKYAETPLDSEEVVPVENELENGIHIDKDITVNFDGNGNWSYSISKYCPINIDAVASIKNAPADAVFDVKIKTNYPQNFELSGLHVGDKKELTIKTNTFSNTKISINVHSSKPNISAVLSLKLDI